MLGRGDSITEEGHLGARHWWEAVLSDVGRVRGTIGGVVEMKTWVDRVGRLSYEGKR